MELGIDRGVTPTKFLGFIIFCCIIAATVAVVLGCIYVAIHFIIKFW